MAAYAGSLPRNFGLQVLSFCLTQEERSGPAGVIANPPAVRQARCHCAEGQGHPMWSLTSMVDRKKHVERIPKDWVEEVRRRGEAGREFKRAVA